MSDPQPKADLCRLCGSVLDARRVVPAGLAYTGKACPRCGATLESLCGTQPEADPTCPLCGSPPDASGRCARMVAELENPEVRTEDERIHGVGLEEVVRRHRAGELRGTAPVLVSRPAWGSLSERTRRCLVAIEALLSSLGDDDLVDESPSAMHERLSVEAFGAADDSKYRALVAGAWALADPPAEPTQPPKPQGPSFIEADGNVVASEFQLADGGRLPVILLGVKGHPNLFVQLAATPEAAHAAARAIVACAMHAWPLGRTTPGGIVLGGHMPPRAS